MPGRTPDKPGTFRIRPDKHGGHYLSGVQSNGSRVRLRGLTETAAKEVADRLFPSVVAPLAPLTTWEQTDDWGFPIKVSDATVDSVRQTLNIPDPAKLQAIAAKPAEPEPPKETPEQAARKLERQKNAKSLMDLVGIGVAWGDVTLGQKLCERVGKEPVKPDKDQVNDLRKNTKEALIDLFGDSEISPWKMAILLAIAIPASMLIQSPRKKIEPETKPASPQGTNLKSVP